MSSYDPTDIQSQQRAQADTDLCNKLAKEAEDADFKWLMGSKQGRRIVWRQLERAGVFRLSFSSDPLAMAFAEGARNDGLRTLAQIHALCPDLYSKMLKEQTHVNRNDDDDDDAGRSNH